jgi:hypothetical protein
VNKSVQGDLINIAFHGREGNKGREKYPKEVE